MVQVQVQRTLDKVHPCLLCHLAQLVLRLMLLLVVGVTSGQESRVCPCCCQYVQTSQLQVHHYCQMGSALAAPSPVLPACACATCWSQLTCLVLWLLEA